MHEEKRQRKDAPEGENESKSFFQKVVKHGFDGNKARKYGLAIASERSDLYNLDFVYFSARFSQFLDLQSLGCCESGLLSLPSQ